MIFKKAKVGNLVIDVFEEYLLFIRNIDFRKLDGEMLTIIKLINAICTLV